MPEQVPLTELGNGETVVSVTVIGASGDLAKKKIFPALFALFYEDCLPEVRFHISNCVLLSTNHAQKQLELKLFSRYFLTIQEDSAVAHDAYVMFQNFIVFGYSRTKLSDEELRNMISTTLTCRVDKRYVIMCNFFNMQYFHIYGFGADGVHVNNGLQRELRCQNEAFSGEMLLSFGSVQL